MQRLIVISREKRDALSLAHRRRKKEADDLRLRRAALTRLSSATLMFAYFFAHIFLRSRTSYGIDSRRSNLRYFPREERTIGCMIKLARGP